MLTLTKIYRSVTPVLYNPIRDYVKELASRGIEDKALTEYADTLPIVGYFGITKKGGQVCLPSTSSSSISISKKSTLPVPSTDESPKLIETLSDTMTRPQRNCTLVTAAPVKRKTGDYYGSGSTSSTVDKDPNYDPNSKKSKISANKKKRSSTSIVSNSPPIKIEATFEHKPEDDNDDDDIVWIN